MTAFGIGLLLYGLVWCWWWVEESKRADAEDALRAALRELERRRAHGR